VCVRACIRVGVDVFVYVCLYACVYVEYVWVFVCGVERACMRECVCVSKTIARL